MHHVLFAFCFSNLSQIREFDVMGGLQTVTKKDAFVKKIK